MISRGRVVHAEDGAAMNPGLPGFETGYDLAGDGSLAGIPLPGHTRSQLGLLFTDEEGRAHFPGGGCVLEDRGPGAGHAAIRDRVAGFCGSCCIS